MTHQMRVGARTAWPAANNMMSLRPADRDWEMSGVTRDGIAPTGMPQDPFAAFLLDAISICAVVVDENAVVRLMSTAGADLLRRPGCGMAAHAAGPGHAGATRLVALHREDNRALRQLVASAARGGPGGSLRIHSTAADGLHESIQVAMVMPLPSGPNGQVGLALVKVEDLGERVAPSSAMLCSIFGFTRSEAEVALRLVGGASAEEVATSRAVSLDTVRHQIRSILRKSEAVNLRDFERLMATLAKFGADGLARPIRRDAGSTLRTATIARA